MGFNDLIQNNERIMKDINFNPLDKFKDYIKTDEYFRQFIMQSIYQRIRRKGTDSKGKKLRTDKAIQSNDYSGSSRVYSPRNKKKSRYTHVDLYETGYMFNTMSIAVKKKSIITKIDLVTNKNSSVYQNFEMSYPNSQAFKDIVFSLNETEIKELNEKLLKRMVDELRKTFNYE